MDGVWLEDGSFEVAPGQKGKFKKGKGKGKGKGKDDGPDAKKARTDEPGAGEEEEIGAFNYERDWKGKQVCLVNLKSAALNGTYGSIKEYLGAETIIIDGKEKLIRRFLVGLEAGKGEKSIKFENLFKVMTGALVKLRGLDSVELNDSVGECGRLDAASMRYDVTLSDGRHVKAKPANVEFVANYEVGKVAGDKAQLEQIRSANSLKDKLVVMEEWQYPVPQVLPAAALEEYAKKFSKAVVIGRSNAANPKGTQFLAREITTATRVPLGSRVVFASMPRADVRQCVAPKLEDMRHDELLRLGKLAGWMAKRCEPRQVFFLLPGTAAKGPPSLLGAATCAWPLYVSLCTEVVVVDSERWKSSAWSRLDALLAVWARKPLYLLPEKYSPPIELPGAEAVKADKDEDAEASARSLPLSFKPEEPLTITRPTDGAGAAGAPAVLGQLAERAYEFEAANGGAKVQCPTLAVRRLG